MAIEHDSIPAGEIHEPKGISSTAAGNVYVSDGFGSGAWETNGGFLNRVVIDATNGPGILAGTIDSSVEYFIDGFVDMGALEITVPAGGITIRGYNSAQSKLFSTSASYTMFNGGTAGNVLLNDFTIDVSGTSSKVYDITGDGSPSSFSAIEVSGINYENCTSLGEITGFRQGLELNTARFGGTPNLILSGTWGGGFRIATSIVRILDSGFSGVLFEEGTSLTMGSRFLVDLNVDLPAGTSGISDFSSSVFAGSSLFQFHECLVTRAGAVTPDDVNYFTGITYTDLDAEFKNNKGISNTFVGGQLTLATPATTTIVTINTPVVLAGAWDTSFLEHFDEPSEGQLRHLGDDPRDYRVNVFVQIEGTATDSVTVYLKKYDASATTTSTVDSKTREILNLTGANDYADFSMLDFVVLDANDYLYLEVENNSGTGNLTASATSTITVEER